jgi:rRNA maturation endonuclease Nob1
MPDLMKFLNDEVFGPMKRRKTCGHEGETHERCSKCGADLRVVTSYECRVCSLMMKPKIYPADKAPDFCIQCGAPKFTFLQIRKKRGRNTPE